MKPNTLKLLTFICPPLAVAFKCGQFSNFHVFLSILLTFAFWIPGIIFAYLFCFVFESSKNKISTTLPRSEETSNSFSTTTTILYNPTPVHPKAKDILSFPTTLNSVIIHIPSEIPQMHYFDYYENNQQQKNLEENYKNFNKEMIVKI